MSLCVDGNCMNVFVVPAIRGISFTFWDNKAYHILFIFLVTAAYLSRVGKHRYGRHEAGRQGHGHWQGRQLSPPRQELLRAFPAPAGPGVVDPDGSGQNQHEGEYYVVLHLQGTDYQGEARHVCRRSGHGKIRAARLPTGCLNCRAVNEP